MKYKQLLKYTPLSGRKSRDYSIMREVLLEHLRVHSYPPPPPSTDIPGRLFYRRKHPSHAFGTKFKISVHLRCIYWWAVEIEKSG